MIRFDMSEYNDSNSDVKLIGSPPGYVGYEADSLLWRIVAHHFCESRIYIDKFVIKGRMENTKGRVSVKIVIFLFDEGILP